MKILITLLGLLNGCYMLLDGIFVLIKGKYIGPEKPGLWTRLFYKLDINIFKLGPLFILFGVLWLGWIFTLWSNHSRTIPFGILLSILTLWYLPFGTLISLLILAVMLLYNQKTGL